MRRVMIGDLLALARGIAELAPEYQRVACHEAFDRAHVADKFRKWHGRLHPQWGDGSVMGYALRGVPQLQCADVGDSEYCHALGVVLACLADWRFSQSRRRCTSEPPD